MKYKCYINDLHAKIYLWEKEKGLNIDENKKTLKQSDRKVSTYPSDTRYLTICEVCQTDYMTMQLIKTYEYDEIENVHNYYYIFLNTNELIVPNNVIELFSPWKLYVHDNSFKYSAFYCTEFYNIIEKSHSNTGLDKVKEYEKYQDLKIFFSCD
ncbi:hypothetical protein A3Q56_01271, partial [Intoshia linei]